jgi:hypothetical protein
MDLGTQLETHGPRRIGAAWRSQRPCRPHPICRQTIPVTLTRRRTKRRDGRSPPLAHRHVSEAAGHGRTVIQLQAARGHADLAHSAFLGSSRFPMILSLAGVVLVFVGAPSGLRREALPTAGAAHGIALSFPARRPPPRRWPLR